MLPQTGEVDMGAFTDGENVQILLTPQSGDYYENKRYDISLLLDFEASAVSVQRIDDDHCNPKRVWKELGAPDNLSRRQAHSIAEQTRLREEPYPFTVEEGRTRLSVTLGTNDVLLLTAYAPGEAKP